MREHVSRLLAVVATSLISVVLAPGTPAQAATDGGVLTGTGTVTPGLTLAGQPGNLMSLNLQSVGSSGLFACRSYDGSDYVGQWAQSAGGGTWTCGGAYSYTRTGNVFILRAVSPGPAVVVCLWTPTSGPTITSFHLDCSWVSELPR